MVNTSGNDAAQYEDLEVIRMRYFYEFITPFVVKCSEEITVYNASKIAINRVAYDLGVFRKNLHILDTSGHQLEFHREIDTYTAEIPLNQEVTIIIEFPREQQLKPKRFKTIVLEYLREVDDYTNQSGDYSFIFDLDDAPRTYIGIRSLSNKFEFIKEPFIFGSDGTIFHPDNLWESDNVTIIESENSFYFNTRELIQGCKLYFKFDHELGKYHSWWFNSGIIIGIAAIIANSFALFNGRSNLVIPFAGLVNAYLLITKGWLFQNDMERVIKGFKINYDVWYVALILILLIEMVLSIIIPFFYLDSFNFTTNLSVQTTLNYP